MNSYQILTPESLPQLISVLGSVNVKTKLLAGGTDLVISLHQGKIRPETVIDLSGVKELSYIEVKDERIEIGAASTFSQISNNKLITTYSPCLAHAASMVGSKQIRNRATLGGNIANASPAADTIPALLVLNAQVETINKEGKRLLTPLLDILAGTGKTSLSYDQVITSISFPMLDSNFISAFTKLGTRSTVTIARISLALAASYDRKGNLINNTRIALGAVGKTAFRVPRLENLLNNQVASKELAKQFAEELTVEIERAIPDRQSLPYKKEAVKGLADSIFAKLFSLVV